MKNSLYNYIAIMCMFLTIKAVIIHEKITLKMAIIFDEFIL